jgi:integrase
MGLMPPKSAVTVAGCYDQALHYTRDHHLPPAAPRPRPTADWPPENLALLERYVAWLLEGGASPIATRGIYLPAAGHVLGLALKPHPQIDLEADFERVMAYTRGKGCGPDWLKATHNGLEKFRRFVRCERGLGETLAITPFDVAAHTQGLPAWLVTELERYQRTQQRNWRPARLDESIRRFWSGHLRMWRFFCEQRGVQQLADLKRQHVLDYVDFRLGSGHAATGVNGDLHTLCGFLGFLQAEGYAVPQALLRVKGLKPPDSLPRFLPDEQVARLRDEIERQAVAATLTSQRRDALLTRAAFYLLWQGGMRLGEVEELRLEDLDLSARRLSVRRGKGLADRTVYLTDTTVAALQDYLMVRGPGASDHVFLYRNQALRKDLIRARLQAAGGRVGVKVYPHRLRHTCATQLLNAGCRITSIQKFLGHKRLDTTLRYAKAHDQTVESDYFTAMQRIEMRLDISAGLAEPAPGTGRTQLLALADELAAPEISLEARLRLAAQMRAILGCQTACAALIVVALPPGCVDCEGAGEPVGMALGP